jgi:hypothetical protein
VDLLLLLQDRCSTGSLVVCAFAGGWVWLSTIAQRTRPNWSGPSRIQRATGASRSPSCLL